MGGVLTKRPLSPTKQGAVGPTYPQVMRPQIQSIMSEKIFGKSTLEICKKRKLEISGTTTKT